MPYRAVQAIEQLRQAGKADVRAGTRKLALTAGREFHEHPPASSAALNAAAPPRRAHRFSEYAQHVAGKEASRDAIVTRNRRSFAPRTAGEDIRGDSPAGSSRHQLHERLAASSAGRRVRRGHRRRRRRSRPRGGGGPNAARRRSSASGRCPCSMCRNVVVADSRVAYGRLCQALVGNPSRQMKVIGVTGTHGKTTVARLLSAILRAGRRGGRHARFIRLLGRLRRPAGRSMAPLTPPCLARSLAEMAAAGATHAVVEVSSRELSQQVLAGVTLDAVCITQVGSHHLDWHGSVENYRQAKRRIFEYLRSRCGRDSQCR